MNTLKHFGIVQLKTPCKIVVIYMLQKALPRPVVLGKDKLIYRHQSTANCGKKYQQLLLP